MTAIRAVAAIVIASLAGCSSAPRHGAVNFYPANAEAKAIGHLTGEYQTVGPGAGSLRAVMPDGEVLIGQYAARGHVRTTSRFKGASAAIEQRREVADRMI
jgi:hypothetical protein